MKKDLLLFLFVFLCSIGFSRETVNFEELILRGREADARVQGAEMIYLSENKDRIKYLKLRPEAWKTPAEAQSWVQKVMGMAEDEGLKLLKSETDELGLTHYRFQQTYDGKPVEGGIWIFHLRNGKVVAMNGDMYPLQAPPVQASVAETQALNLAKKHIGAKKYKWEDSREEAWLKSETGDAEATYFPEGELTYVPEQGDYQNASFRLAWKFDIYAHKPVSRRFLFVDAQNGNILWEQERIHAADSLGTAVTRYSGNQPMVADFTGTNFRLRETGRGNGIRTYDLNESQNFGNAVDFFDNNNFWNNVNAQEDEVATDAHWGAEMTYDYFSSVHNRNSIDGNGFALISYVHYGQNYVNAGWDGQRMIYGDGNGTSFTPLTAIDVTGHEIAHGLTTFSANLVYANESGALNESFSDIFGAAIENYARPTNWSWRIGEDMTSNGNGIRNMANPNQFGDPDTYFGTNWYTGTADNGGVHTNSGVQNFWYYLLTTGGSGTNDLGNSYSITGLGFLKSSQIAFRNLTVYLSNNSTYNDARFYAIQSAIDLFGPCTPEVIATTNAWYAVGVGGQFVNTVIADFDVDQDSICSIPALVNFSNKSTNGGSFTWDFGDGSTGTSTNPAHTYSNYGTYTVSLIANGGPCGQDTTVQVSIITVDSTIPCNVLMSPGGTNITQTSCTGTLFDPGGPSGNYPDNINSTITIAPPGVAGVNLTFQSFDLESNFDYLYIYDGANTSANLIGTYTGTALPGGGTISSTSGAITLQITSDQAVNEPGFEVDWACVAPTAAPNTDFSADKITTCDGAINFSDLTTGGVNTWNWNFGDGNVSAQQNPSHTYYLNGTYTVTLVASNGFGSDTETKTTYITVNRPSAPSATGASICGAGTATLSATGTGPFTWYDNQFSSTPVGTGSSFTTPVINSTTNYYVEEEVPQASQNAGPANNTYGGGGYFNNNARNLIFDVLAPCKLRTVLVYAQSAGNRTIEWRDASGAVIEDTTLNIPAGQQRITLNFDLVPGTGYELGLSGNLVDLYRNNTNSNFPYTLPGYVSITGTDATSSQAFYYFFYDWEIEPEACISERAPVTVTVNTPPSPGISAAGSTTFCSGGSVTLNATGGSSYSWSNGQTGSSISVNQSGAYTVTTTDANGCTGTSSAINVTVNQAPTPAITANGPTTLCPGNTVVLSAPTSSAYNWSTGATSQSITVNSSGTYTVTVTDGNGCNGTSAPVQVSVTNTPSANISTSGSPTLCQGDTVILTATQGNAYLWSNGASTQSIPVTTPGNYTVSVTYPGGCSATSSAQNVTVNALPSPAITAAGPTTFCDGDSVILTATGGSSYLWSDGSTGSMLNVKLAGTYSVTATDANGCSATTPTSIGVTVNANPQPIITAGGPLSFCEGSSVSLSTGAAAAYNWSSGDTTSSITVSLAGDYSVAVTDANGCSGTSPKQTVTVWANPTADFAFTANNQQVSFSDQSSGNQLSWAWDFGDGITSGLQNPNHTYAASGIYNVLLIVTTADGCSDTIQKTVNVTFVGIEEADRMEVQIFPNPFSNRITISIQGAEAKELRAEVRDALGRMIWQRTAQTNAGKTTWVWEVPSTLASGPYLLNLWLGEKQIQRKLLKME